MRWIGLLCLAGASLTTTAGAGSSLSWFAPDGSEQWRASLESRPAAHDMRLEAARWFPPLPEISLTMIDGPDRRLDAPGGKVLILDFWATWCEPCAVVLPKLAALQAAEAERGLEVVTVNMEEADETVRQYAWALDLKLPVGRYDAALEEAFNVNSLPTSLVADRFGRIRARWNGYQQGLEDKLFQLTELLLDEETPPVVEVARVTHGVEQFSARWVRTAPNSIDSLVVLEREGESPAILVSAGRDLLRYDREGRPARRWSRIHSLGSLRVGEGAVFAVRRGGTRITPIDPVEGPLEAWDAPAPVLDAEIVPDTGAEIGLLLVTTEGFRRVGLNGADPAAAPTPEGLSDVTTAQRAGEAELAWLGDDGLGWFSGGKLATEPPGKGGSLLGAPGVADGFGLASPSVREFAAGRFDGATRQLALAAGDELIVLDLDGGAELFRASWPGIAALSAADLDEDGRDELLVAAGNRFAVLQGGRPEPKSEATTP